MRLYTISQYTILSNIFCLLISSVRAYVCVLFLPKKQVHVECMYDMCVCYMFLVAGGGVEPEIRGDAEADGLEQRVRGPVRAEKWLLFAGGMAPLRLCLQGT